MSNILITGATGNIGFEVIKYLCRTDSTDIIFAAVRNVEKAKKIFKDFPKISFRYFDFEASDSFDNALNNIDRVFLLRPPHIADVDKYFKPLIASIKKHKIKEIVFLSVQGADKSKVIPHNKIERLIRENSLDYIFLRPSYFMQNLTTTLLDDIKTKCQIILPAGKAKFNWIDIENIGEVAAIILQKFMDYRNKSYDVTGYENESFEEVTRLMNDIVRNQVLYRNFNLLSFYRIKQKSGMVRGMILVMIFLHFLPRFQKAPVVSGFYEQLTGKRPTSLKEFIEREKHKFE